MIAHSPINRNQELEVELKTWRDESEPWRFKTKDILNVAGIKGILFPEENDTAAISNPARVILMDQIAGPIQNKLKTLGDVNGDNTESRAILAGEFNKLIRNSGKVKKLIDLTLHTKHQIILRESTDRLLHASPEGKEHSRLGRLLIEDCFSGAVNQLPGDWESPDEWLGKQRDGIPSIDAIRQMAPNVASWLLLEALCKPPAAEENLLSGILPIIGNLDDKVSETMTRKEWFQRLGNLLQNKEEPDKMFSKCLEKHWGPLIVEVVKGNGTERRVNPICYAALVASRLRLWYDPHENAFYWYRPKYGTWTFLTDVEVQRLVLDWMLGQKEVPEAKPSLQMAKEVLNHLRVIALYDKTDTPASVVHLADCMLYLKEKRESADFSPAYFSKNCIPIPFPLESDQNFTFGSFLRKSIPEDDIDLLKNWCGYVLLGRNPGHKILLIRGSGGTGKSTLMDIIEAVIGPQNVATLNVERLDDRFELAAFRDKTLLIGKDVASNVLKNQAAHTLKALSGDRGIEAELKFENRRFKLSGPFNIVLTSNADMEIGLRGDAEAWERRLLVIDFNVKPETPILDFASQIIKDKPSGILNWMLQGASRVLAMERARERLKLSFRQKERLYRLLRQSSSVDTFIEHCIEVSARGYVSTDNLYQAYLDFCSSQVFHPIDKETFWRRIRGPLFQCHHARPTENVTTNDNQRLRGYKGIAIKDIVKWPRAYRKPSKSVISEGITNEDILDLNIIIQKLGENNNPCQRWVCGSLTKDEKESLFNPNQSATDKVTGCLKPLVNGLNRFINSARIDGDEAEDAIKTIQMRQETKDFLALGPSVTADVKRFKRMLLEDIFPAELKRMKETEDIDQVEPNPDTTKPTQPNTDNTQTNTAF